MQEDSLGAFVREAVSLQDYQREFLMKAVSKIRGGRDGSSWIKHLEEVLGAGLPSKYDLLPPLGEIQVGEDLVEVCGLARGANNGGLYQELEGQKFNQVRLDRVIKQMIA